MSVNPTARPCSGKVATPPSRMRGGHAKETGYDGDLSRLEVIQQAIAKRMRQTVAAKRLDLSEQQAKRLVGIRLRPDLSSKKKMDLQVAARTGAD